MSTIVQKVKWLDELEKKRILLEEEINNMFSCRCLGSKHYNIQYGIGHTGKYIYITVVKKSIKKENYWIHVELWKYDINTNEESFLIDTDKLRKKHKQRLIKLTIALKNRITSI